MLALVAVGTVSAALGGNGTEGTVNTTIGVGDYVEAEIRDADGNLLPTGGTSNEP